MDTIGTNYRASGCRCAVFEMNDYGTISPILQRVNAFVEMCTFGGNALNKLVEKMRAMHALLARGVELSMDELALMLSFALDKEFQSQSDVSEPCRKIGD